MWALSSLFTITARNIPTSLFLSIFHTHAHTYLQTHIREQERTQTKEKKIDKNLFQTVDSVPVLVTSDYGSKSYYMYSVPYNIINSEDFIFTTIHTWNFNNWKFHALAFVNLGELLSCAAQIEDSYWNKDSYKDCWESLHFVPVEQSTKLEIKLTLYVHCVQISFQVYN